MKHALYIVTGSSRGLGEALARQLLAPDHTVIGLARGHSAALEAASAGRSLEQWAVDLAHPLAAAERLRDWLRAHRDWRSATLINNAALLSEPGPIERTPLAELAAAARVGFEAPMLLASAFLAETVHLGAECRVLNISSGLGRRAMAGAAPYCGIKAGLDNLSRAMALDGIRVVSLAPGIIDTDMQHQLRSADPAGFPELARFQAFKAEGALLSADDCARQVLRYLARPDFGAAVLADVRDA